ncbi:MAG: LIC12162 family protein, partial [Calditrichaeota bacterium]|nr:LIC12162 family protein [Calditrichota bacterium]
MFLATTAMEEFWDTSQKLVYLGEWCKLYERREVWSRLDSVTVAYHWNDREKFHSDYEYLKGVYETYLPLLAAQLNDVHGTEHSPRYWRVVAGWWLRCYIDVLFDRYESVRTAQEKQTIETTWVPVAPDSLAANDFLDFHRFMVSDEYNQFLFGKIIRYLGTIPYEEKPHDFSAFVADIEQVHSISTGGGLKQRLRRLLTKSGKFAPDSLKQIVFVHSYFNPASLAKLQFLLKQYPLCEIDSSSGRALTTEADANVRKQLTFAGATDSFTQLLDHCIPESLPKTYLELYSVSVEKARAIYPARCKVVFTATSHLIDDVFKLWAAAQLESGSKLAVCQHGGHRGTGLHNSALEHELKISDTYFSWGWQGSNGYNVLQAPASKLVSIERSQKCSNIYFNLSSYGRYSTNLYSIPFGALWAQALDFQISVMKKLPAEVRRAIKCRPYMHDFGWKEADRFR